MRVCFRFLVVFIVLGNLCSVFQSKAQFSKHYTISGYIRDGQSSEALIGAYVLEGGKRSGVASNSYGFYSLSLHGGEIALQVSSVGYAPQLVQFELTKDTVLNFSLDQATKALEAVEITAQKEEVSGVEGSVHILRTKDIRKSSPQLMGEVDVIKSLHMLPGVQGGKEGSTDLVVRGGDPGQNLILLDGVPVYNVSHSLGLLSAFNSDAIKQVKMVKGGFPARYGGRLSSVIDIQMKEGNREELSGAFETGLISSKLTLDGPLNDRSSFLVSARVTPLGYIAEGLQHLNGSRQRVGYHFYDLNMKGNYRFSDQSVVYLSLYSGKDAFSTVFSSEDGEENEETNYRMAWGNYTGSLRWNWQPHKKVFVNTTAIFSQYGMDIETGVEGTRRDYIHLIEFKNELAYRSGIQDQGIKVDIDYFPHANHQVKAGGSFIRHVFSPQAISAETQNAEVDGQQLIYLDTIRSNNHIQALETVAFLEDEWQIGQAIRLNAGLHFSNFQLSDTTYRSLQPRVALHVQLLENLAFTSSYARMQQNLHLLGNSSVGLPTDIWVPSTNRVAPENAWQVTAGIAGRWKMLDFGIEGYYKKMDQVVDFVNGTDFLKDGPETDLTQDANLDWQDRLLSGKGEAQGVEFMINKAEGSFTGSLAYTLARSKRQFDEINNGQEFSFRYDRRHSIALNTHYAFSEKVGLGANWTYQSGYYMSLPVSSYRGVLPADILQGDLDWDWSRRIDHFGEKNNFRTPVYHRLDIYASFRKEKKRVTRTWNVGIYNVYNRHNPYFIHANNRGGNLRSMSVFTILPSFSYRLEF